MREGIGHDPHMALRRYFVQFMHPGREHGPDAESAKRWNTNEHRRKFLRIEGEYRVTAAAASASGPVVFWGEWEPESRVAPISEPGQSGSPRWLHEPYYVPPSGYRRDEEVLQNTDPFVFGGPFLYTLCRQFRSTRGRWRPTFLRDLAPGSLVLFGSLLKKQFVLDTVFVVADSVLHTGADWPRALAGRISEEYADVTLRPMYEWGSTEDQFRLYFGATVEQPVGGMFSFVPCLPADEGIRGFARPAIRLEGLITSGLMMGAKATRDLSLAELRDTWQSVVEQVSKQGLALGVRLAMPKVEGGSPPQGRPDGSQADADERSGVRC